MQTDSRPRCRNGQRLQARVDALHNQVKALLAEADSLREQEASVNADETGHKNNGASWWTWCFRAELYSLYRIDAHRSADVLMDLLGKEFQGVLGCDYFSTYRLTSVS